MTKADIVREIAMQTGLEKQVVLQIVEGFMDSVKSAMINGEEIYLRGFGSFIIKYRAEKTARNISRNTTIIVPAHNIPAFKPSKAFVERMKSQIEKKMEAGFRCVKLKIGAIDFEKELALLRHIRTHFSSKEIELRVDANGAFSPGDAMEKLKRLSEFDLHSIEQPIRAGQWEEMARLTSESPLPIALDEELIGCNTLDEKKKLLATIRPQYIIIKPSLHGGICGGDEWIMEAEKQHIGWWITSALESNIGLNAIAHWCATFNNPLPQGLGTGMLFTDNIEVPLEIRKDCLWFCNDAI